MTTITITFGTYQMLVAAATLAAVYLTETAETPSRHLNAVLADLESAVRISDGVPAALVDAARAVVADWRAGRAIDDSVLRLGLERSAIEESLEEANAI